MLLSIADTFIKRPVLTTVCSLLILLVGSISIPLLPIEQLPPLALTQITVQANYTGADAETVEKTVTNIIEREVNGVEGMEYITSSSSNNGQSSIQVFFNASRDKDLAQVDVQNRVARAEPRLPQSVQQLGVTVEAQSPSLLLVYRFYAENEAYDDLFLSNYVDLFVIDEIRRVNGVGSVQIFGERTYAMRLWLDPDALAARNLTATDVTNAIREQNIQVAAGSIGGQPAPENQAYELNVTVDGGRFRNATEFENTVLEVGAEGSLIKIKDVGRAELGAETYSQSVQTNSKPGVGIGVYLLPGSNALDVAENVKEVLAELKQNFPPNFTASMVFDTTDFVKVSLSEVFFTLLQAIGLVVLILFIFLQDWRATLIPAIAIPVALIGAMSLLLVAGFSINTLTLFGCILASGLVVDDAIVVVEAVATKINQGMRPRLAAIDAMNELTGAVISTSLVLFAVFIPVAFFPGTTGRIYQQFTLTIAFTILFSTFNALTFSPSMAGILLRRKDNRRGPLAGFFALFNTALSKITDAYTNLVEFLIKIRYIVVGIFAVFLAITVWMYQTVPGGFVPEEDQGYFLGIIQAPEGVSLDYTQKVIDKADKIIQEIPEIRSTFMISGFSFGGSSPNRGLFFVSLQNWSERTGKGQTAPEIVARLNREFFTRIDEANIFVFNAPPVRGLSSFGGFEMQLTDRSGGQLEINDLLANANDIIGAANQNPDLTRVLTQFTANTPQLKLEIDREKLKALNVDFDDAMTTLGTYLGSQYINDFTFAQRSYRVYAQAESEFRDSPQDISRFYVRSNDGQMISLDQIVSQERITGPTIINHHNLFRAITLQGQAAPGVSSGQALRSMEQIYQETAIPNVGRDWIGTAKEELASGNQSLIIFGLGLTVVFLVLAAQYESYIDPIIIMLTVPLAMLGALVFLSLRGLTLDVYAQVGLVMLIGLASKNAILIVEYANLAREQGANIKQAAIKAAEQRFRPILMTAISSLMGFFPLVIATGAGSASRWSVGTTVFGGLLVATALSFLIVPVLYVVIKSLAESLFNPKPPQSPPRDREPVSPSITDRKNLQQPSISKLEGS
ncbi:MAG: efflux RND transporter permease subunit [Prochloraceae cyanobacterium]